MIAFIVYFFPAVVSLWIYEKLNKQTLSPKDWIYRFCLNTTLINGICFAVKKWILHTATVSLSSFSADMTPDVACNYLIIALLLSAAFAVAEVFLSRHVRVEIENDNAPKEEQNEKNQHAC